MISEAMCKNKKALDLVMRLKPTDLMKSLISDMALVPKDAAKVVMSLRKQAESVMVRRDFPTPTTLKGDDEVINSLTNPEELDEFAGAHGPESPPRHHLPPDPIDEPGEWPYDDMTTAGMATKNKQRKRSITSSKKPKKRINRYVFGNVNDKDLAVTAPGVSGKGVSQKSAPHSDGDQPSGGSSWSTRGRPGWSSSPPGKEFEIPPKSLFTKDRKRIEDDNQKVVNAGDNDDEPSIFKNANTGQGIPQMGHGGRNPGRRLGFRKR